MLRNGFILPQIGFMVDSINHEKKGLIEAKHSWQAPKVGWHEISEFGVSGFIKSQPNTVG